MAWDGGADLTSSPPSHGTGDEATEDVAGNPDNLIAVARIPASSIATSLLSYKDKDMYIERMNYYCTTQEEDAHVECII